ncbi:ABC transporter substrate-binding protein [Ruania halotolerans]|uniref:ABC transporter substrate-binding protein n=1 Tax=Ruania halotolerans TaxID=2897773 RepID=UPI001E6561C9|nr:ABC transporter substrate-binding protein [Ruania halotolerans]UFU05249.1 ABC transporter substrate-binding protein [Ruania halotolerans]
MTTPPLRRRFGRIHPRRFAGAVAAASALTLLAACGGSSDPLETGDDETPADADSSVVVVGSQAYYSNEIIAEIYAQVLEGAGFEVERQFQIGQRDSYLAAMEGDEVDLIPEYSGNLLQFYDSETEARSPEDVAAALPEALPEGLAVLDYAEAQDADSYNVTTEFSESNQITSLADLANYDGEITIGGNAELESRPYGPEGLAEFYGVEAGFLTIGDSGGPLTKDAIRDGTITMGDIYTADPDLASGEFVTLEDPENMILAQNVIPLVDAALAEDLAAELGPVNEALTTEDLIAMNARSVDEQLDSATIATDWLAEAGLA